MQKFEEASHAIFYCADAIHEGHLKSKKGKQTIHLQRATQTKTIIVRIVLACSQLCIYAAECFFFGLIRTLKTKKFVTV